MTDAATTLAETPVTDKKQLKARLKELGRRAMWGTINGILYVLTSIVESYLRFFEGIKSWTAAAILASFVAAGGSGTWFLTVPKRNDKIAELTKANEITTAENTRLDKENTELGHQIDGLGKQYDSLAKKGIDAPPPPPPQKKARRPVLKKQPEAKGFWEKLTTGSLP